MSAEVIQLTKDPQKLARILHDHVFRERMRNTYRRTWWLLAYYYMLGARHFSIYDPSAGAVNYSFRDNKGHPCYASPELLSQVNRVTDRIVSADLRPWVSRTGRTLRAIRERAIAQVFADSLVAPQQVVSVAEQFAYHFSLLGSCGITGHLVDLPTVGLVGDLEVVHPLQLMSFPSSSSEGIFGGGMLRERTCPVSYLENIFGRRKIQGMKEKMAWFEIEPGASIDRSLTNPDPTTVALTDNRATDSRMTGGGGTGPGYTAAQTDRLAVAVVRELWVPGPRETVARYVIASGDAIIDDQDLEGLETYCPIGFARFMQNGSFHGAGIFDTMFWLSRMAEQLQQQLFKNTMDIDRYGVLVIPHGSFNMSNALRDVGQGLKVLPWEPDPIGEGFRPFAIQPFNSGDVPGRTSQFALGLIDRVNPLQDIIREKGRVDSAQGLQMLDEQVTRTLSGATRGIQKAFGNCYRAMVAAACRETVRSPRAIPVEHLTIDLAGAQIDRDTMSVSFEKNPIPNVSRLQFGVRQAHPRSEVARKQEAVQLIAQFPEQIDFDRFMLIAMDEGLDFAIWADDYENAHEMVTTNILLLYGDGVTNQRIVLVPLMVKAEFQLRELTAFMSGPVMAEASVKVKNDFLSYHRFLMGQTGMMLPQATPNPDDAAIYTQGAQVMAQQIAQMQQMQLAAQQAPAPPQQAPPLSQGHFLPPQQKAAR